MQPCSSLHGDESMVLQMLLLLLANVATVKSP
jgi:hypothetical protein